MKKFLTLLSFTFLFFGCSDEERSITGKVIGHAITTDANGNTNYHTIIRCEDSIIRDRGGLKFYGMDTGRTVHLYKNK